MPEQRCHCCISYHQCDERGRAGGENSGGRMDCRTQAEACAACREVVAMCRAQFVLNERVGLLLFLRVIAIVFNQSQCYARCGFDCFIVSNFIFDRPDV